MNSIIRTKISNQRRVLRALSLPILLGTVNLSASEWFCEEVASQRDGNIIKACGIGESATEASARSLAFENAKKEFDRICNASADCNGHQSIADPKRTSCKQTPGKNVVCHRLVSFQIVNSESSIEPEDGVSPSSEIDELKFVTPIKGAKLLSVYELTMGIGVVAFVEVYSGRRYREGLVRELAGNRALAQASIGRYEVKEGKITTVSVSTTCPSSNAIQPTSISWRPGAQSLSYSLGPNSVSLPKVTKSSRSSGVFTWGCFAGGTFQPSDWIDVE